MLHIERMISRWMTKLPYTHLEPNDYTHVYKVFWLGERSICLYCKEEKCFIKLIKKKKIMTSMLSHIVWFII